MKYLQWEILPPAEAGSLPLSILAARGITAQDDIERFFQSPLSCLHDPFELPDMRKAAERINRAIAANEKIAVCGDYDVDGVTATCLLLDYLHSRGAVCEHFIPNRETDGYGLPPHVVRDFGGKGVTLIITVDVGVMAFDAAEAAKESGIDLIITDHHSCRDVLPDAFAVVNPRRADSAYPFPQLAGAGVAFKLACALEADFKDTPSPQMKMVMKYGDLVALGTVADIMPLTGENRILTAHGLSKLSSSPRPGIDFLLKELGMKNKPLTASTISFHLAPVLNAAGRMKSAELALELLMTADPARAQYLTSVLTETNQQRRRLESVIFTQADTECAAMPPEAPAIVLSHTDWHQGVTGIAASRLLEKYGKPVFIITINGETGKGTARCPKHINLVELLEKCSAHLLGFGGHQMAAGFTISADKIQDFAAAVQSVLAGTAHKPCEAALLIDAVVSPAMLTKRSAEGIAAMSPFGASNPEPVLMLEGVIIKQITPLKEGKHLRLTINAAGQSFPVICFGFVYNEFPHRAGDMTDIAFCLSLNHFRGESTLQLELKDIR